MDRRLVWLVAAGMGVMALHQAESYAAPKNSNASSKPIEITADELEVFREENKAIFTGDVDAVQGDMNLRSSVMIVYYKDSGGNKSEAASAMGGSGISRIEAKGNVFLSTPKETAQGKEGNYDLDSKVVKLNQSVILTQGKNVVKGDHFVYNLATGHSKIWSGSENQEDKTSPKGTKGEKQRVRSVFVPGDGKKAE